MKNLPQTIGWVLLHFTWQATVIAAVYKCMDQRLQRSRADLRYNVTLAALLCMFGTSIATLVYEQARINRVHVSETASAVVPIGVSASPLQEHLADAQRILVHLNTVHLFKWLDCVWVVGVLFCSIHALGGAFILRRVRSTLSVEPNREMAEVFRGLVDRMGISRRVSFRMHHAAFDPFVAGVFRSIVYLPFSALSSLTPDQIEAVLAHELAHVHRADYIWNLLNTFLEIIFFFHPAVWWLGRRLREQRELCCDDIVLETCSSRMIYAKALLALAKNRQISLRFALSAGGHGRRQLFSRIERILGNESSTQRHSKASIALGIVIPAVLLVTVANFTFAAATNNHVPTVQAAVISASSIRFKQKPAKSESLLSSKRRSNPEQAPTRRDTIRHSPRASKVPQSERSRTELPGFAIGMGDGSETFLRIHNHQHHDHQHDHHHTHEPDDLQSADG